MGLTAADIMSTEVLTIRPQHSVRDLAEFLTIHKVSGAPVVDDAGRLVGVVSQSDLVALNKPPRPPAAVTLFDLVIYLEGMGRLKAELAKMSGTTVADIMTRQVISVGLTTPLEAVATLMSEKKVHTIPVLDQGRLVGVIGRLDIIRSLLS